MTGLSLIFLMLLAVCSTQRIVDNEIDNEDVSPFQEAAKALLQNENGAGLAGIVSNFLQSEGGKHLGDMLMGASSNNDATGQILSGINNILSQNSEGSSNDGGLNPALIGSIMGMFNSQQANGKGAQEGLDIGTIANLVGTFMNQGQEQGQGRQKREENEENLFNYLPLIMNTISSFTGPEAQAREEKHKDHAWALPPIVERIHIFFDHIMNSELGAKLTTKLGGEKFVKMFTDESGKFNYEKFVELMENQSFRRHWIQLVTNRIAQLIAFIADPYTQKNVLQTSQFFINSFLQSQGFPTGAMFNPEKPVESISAGVNHISKKYTGQSFDVKQYVVPVVKYVQELFTMAQQKGILGRAVDSNKLSDKLADTINLDIIEPILRVNRAYKFAVKHPKCDKYVMCLVNENPNEDTSTLPALKKMLGKTTSFAMSWFLSQKSQTSFWTFYDIIMNEDKCQAYYSEVCHGFHLDELRVTTELVHNEL